jgi:hypothetical protein
MLFDVFEAKLRVDPAEAYNARYVLKVFMHPTKSPEETFQVRMRTLKLLKDAS